MRQSLGIGKASVGSGWYEHNVNIPLKNNRQAYTGICTHNSMYLLGKRVFLNVLSLNDYHISFMVYYCWHWYIVLEKIYHSTST